jgi:predicted nucleotidyltransferase
MHASIRSHIAELSALCRRHGVRRLELFGSAARDREAIGDLDFLVEFEALDPNAYADAYFGLLEDLEQLFGRPVDLIMTSAITNPYFLQEVARTRTVVYGS